MQYGQLKKRQREYHFVDRSNRPQSLARQAVPVFVLAARNQPRHAQGRPGSRYHGCTCRDSAVAGLRATGRRPGLFRFVRDTRSFPHRRIVWFITDTFYRAGGNDLIADGCERHSIRPLGNGTVLHDCCADGVPIRCCADRTWPGTHGGAAQFPVASGIDGIHQCCRHHHRIVATRPIGRAVAAEQSAFPRGHRSYPCQYG